MSSVDIKICIMYVLNVALMDRKLFISSSYSIMNIGVIYYCVLG
jgi:hypothetical protein